MNEIGNHCQSCNSWFSADTKWCFHCAGELVSGETYIRKTHITELYFECHITIEPVYGERLELLKTLAEPCKFKVADLLMRKRLEDTPKRSQFDTFLTGRDTEYFRLATAMLRLISELNNYKFQVWRYKIENTLLDVKLR